jgi:hypothetical protein
MLQEKLMSLWWGSSRVGAYFDCKVQLKVWLAISLLQTSLTLGGAMVCGPTGGTSNS